MNGNLRTATLSKTRTLDFFHNLASNALSGELLGYQFIETIEILAQSFMRDKPE